MTWVGAIVAKERIMVNRPLFVDIVEVVGFGKFSGSGGSR
jgi:hypothetical protein